MKALPLMQYLAAIYFWHVAVSFVRKEKTKKNYKSSRTTDTNRKKPSKFGALTKNDLR